MKYLTILAAIFMISTNSDSQKQLVLIQTSITNTYGGMEDGGISSTYAYRFIARAKIQMQNVLFDDQLLKLKKNDTLEFRIHVYSPYNQHELVIKDSTDTIAPTTSVSLLPLKTAKYNGTFVINTNGTINWEKALKYTFRGKSYQSELKEIPPEVRNYYAP